MSTKDLKGLANLLARLDAAAPIVARRDMYYRGRQPLRFMVDEVDEQLSGFNVNLCRVAVQALAERLRVTGFDVKVDGRDVSDRAWELWRRSNMDMLLGPLLADALALGSAYLIPWVDGVGRAVITGETADHVAVEHDPITGGVVAAVKRWQVTDANGVVVEEHAVKYLPTRIVHLRKSAATGRYAFVSAVDNPLEVVPVVPLINVDRVGDRVGYSVIDDMAPLVDALSKLMADMLTASEAVARPRRWATGVNLEDDEDSGFMVDAPGDDGFMVDGPVPPVPGREPDAVKSPFADDNRMMVSEDPASKFGQLPGADLKGYQTAADLILQQIMAVSALPAHMAGVTTSNPATAEAMRASESSLTTRGEHSIRVFDAPVEWAVRLLVAIDEGVSPERVEASTRWADPATRSVAQEADAAVKLHADGLLSLDEARQRVGIDPTTTNDEGAAPVAADVEGDDQ